MRQSATLLFAGPSICPCLTLFKPSDHLQLIFARGEKVSENLRSSPRIWAFKNDKQLPACKKTKFYWENTSLEKPEKITAGETDILQSTLAKI